MDKDKKIFLLDKGSYRKEVVENLSENDLEKWVADEDYDFNYTMLKIDANQYETIYEALVSEGILFAEDYYIMAFGFD